MIKIGVVSISSNVGKTVVSLGISDALVASGNNLLFLDFSVPTTAKTILQPTCKSNIKDYINKKSKLVDIISRMYNFNFDLVACLDSDRKWLKLMDWNALKTSLTKLMSDLDLLQHYDYGVIDFGNDFLMLNEVLSYQCDYLIIVVDPKVYDKQTAISIINLVKLRTQNKTKKFNTAILLSMFEQNSQLSNTKALEIDLVFGKLLLPLNIPFVKFNDYEHKSFKNSDNRIIQLSKKLQSVFYQLSKILFIT